MKSSKIRSLGDWLTEIIKSFKNLNSIQSPSIVTFYECQKDDAVLVLMNNLAYLNAEL